jgi:predicted small secreted protein
LKKLFNNIQLVIIVVLIIIIILQQQCSGPSTGLNLFNKNLKQPTPIEGTVITKIETKWDTIKIDSLIYVPKWRTHTITEYDTIPANIDTLSILKDYYTKYFYTDTLDLDTLGNIVINDTISQNLITSRKIIPNIYIPTTTIERDSLISKNEFYYGFGLAGNKQQFNYIGGELLWRSKRKKVIGLGVGINQNLQPVLTGRLFWKIGK